MTSSNLGFNFLPSGELFFYKSSFQNLKSAWWWHSWRSLWTWTHFLALESQKYRLRNYITILTIWHVAWICWSHVFSGIVNALRFRGNVVRPNPVLRTLLCPVGGQLNTSSCGQSSRVWFCSHDGSFYVLGGRNNFHLPLFNPSEDSNKTHHLCTKIYILNGAKVPVF